MWPVLIAMAAGAALGAAKNAEDKKNFRKEQKMNAVKARYSPWSDMRPRDVARPNQMGDIMSGAVTGAMMGQQIPNMNKVDNYLDTPQAPTGYSTAPTNANSALDYGGGPTNNAAMIYQGQQQGVNPWDLYEQNKRMGRY